MDPNATLTEMLDLAQDISDEHGNIEDAYRLSDLVIALDEWIRKGGFLPGDWENNEATH